jgi:hypothetical protein
MVKKLNKRYNTKMKIPIEFNYNNRNIYTSSKIPKALWVDAQSTGWRLLQHKIGLKNDPLVFNIGNFFETSLTISKEDLLRFMNNNIKGVAVNQILEDHISLEFESLKSKEITLTLSKSNHNTTKLNHLTNYKITPSAVIVRGPSSLIKALQQSEEIFVPIDPANQSPYSSHEHRVFFDSSITCSPPTVKVELYFNK